ncbi:MAG: hypothetical protein U5K38_06140 [Woeseiaceae bacterium]|nr:hypothetical protein [Woeseiaceae bacterium]
MPAYCIRHAFDSDGQESGGDLFGIKRVIAAGTDLTGERGECSCHRAAIQRFVVARPEQGREEIDRNAPGVDVGVRRPSSGPSAGGTRDPGPRAGGGRAHLEALIGVAKYRTAAGRDGMNLHHRRAS